jgi:hypothetical protein
MFGNISGTWLDGAFFNVLKYVDGMHLFFMSQVRIVAMICFVLSFGISCVKMLMGAMELNKVLTQAFISVATYFIMIFMFPLIMINMQKIVSQLAHGAVFSQGFDTKFETKYGKEEDYFAYLNKIGSDKSGNTIWSVSVGENGRRALNLQITHKETGLISLNKVFQMVIATFKAMWGSLSINGIGDFFKHIPDFLMIIGISLMYLWSLAVAIVNYAMVVVQYVFLYGMGALFIPMMLWEGSKHAFASLCGSIFKIGIKLLVVQVSLYLAAMANMDILKNMFVLSDGKADFLQSMEFYLSIAFMVVFIKLFVDQAPAIADFLSGGQPSLNFGDFARAAASGAAAGAMAMGAGKSMAKGAVTTGAALAGAVGAAGGAARTSMSLNKAQGHGLGTQLIAGAANFGKSIGQSAKQGGANMLDKGLNAISNAPQATKNFGQSMKHGVDPSNPSPQAAKGGSSYDNNAPNDGKSNGQRSMDSKNISERVQGMGELYKENRAQGGEYSGLGGRMKALKSSVGEFHKANKEAAPGYIKKT